MDLVLWRIHRLLHRKQKILQMIPLSLKTMVMGGLIIAEIMWIREQETALEAETGQIREQETALEAETGQIREPAMDLETGTDPGTGDGSGDWEDPGTGDGSGDDSGGGDWTDPGTGDGSGDGSGGGDGQTRESVKAAIP